MNRRGHLAPATWFLGGPFFRSAQPRKLCVEHGDGLGRGFRVRGHSGAKKVRRALWLRAWSLPPRALRRRSCSSKLSGGCQACSVSFTASAQAAQIVENCGSNPVSVVYFRQRSHLMPSARSILIAISGDRPSHVEAEEDIHRAGPRSVS
jgi:hypothetical protein